ncbi:hypothetical protein [Bradyrhizobium zhanjiangense]|uniref:hypothetical protein n=1 Tax=Bradyrhizobium zhanjiangense TaxID=1325107 RepID=UPI001008AA62|nr:hypothetical protein [Bradyrhizobium zhanjiangense]
MMRHIARPAHTREVHLFWRTSELSAYGVDATHDDGQQIVEIVCHTAGKLSHDFIFDRATALPSFSCPARLLPRLGLPGAFSS